MDLFEIKPELHKRICTRAHAHTHESIEVIEN